MEQLSNIVALMLAEAIFAYESSFEIKVSGSAHWWSCCLAPAERNRVVLWQLSDQFAMMFDMQLSFSFDSLKVKPPCSVS